MPYFTEIKSSGNLSGNKLKDLQQTLPSANNWNVDLLHRFRVIVKNHDKDYITTSESHNASRDMIRNHTPWKTFADYGLAGLGNEYTRKLTTAFEVSEGLFLSLLLRIADRNAAPQLSSPPSKRLRTKVNYASSANNEIMDNEDSSQENSQNEDDEEAYMAPITRTKGVAERDTWRLIDKFMEIILYNSPESFNFKTKFSWRRHRTHTVDINGWHFTATDDGGMVEEFNITTLLEECCLLLEAKMELQSFDDDGKPFISDELLAQ
ncbi:hypothetical protein F4679DRAFT_590536 [Xylaria curta]|nr:hypothetical protein F4679DRAFT_590536 [Xylaria curta]